ncbi:MAG: cell division protein PerM [Candidatus Nanopelagicales bacterium]
MTAPTLPPRAGAPAAAPVRAAAVGRALRMAGARLRRPWLAGGLAAAWAAVIGLVAAALPMLIAWMATPGSGFTWLESLRAAGVVWSIAQGTPLVIGATTYSLLPWGLGLVSLALLGYAGGRAARTARARSWRSIAALVGAGALTYALIAVAVARVATPGDAAVGMVAAAVHAVPIAVAGLGFGSIRAAGLAGRSGMPAWLLVMARAGMAGAATLVGLGAVAATVALMVRVDDAVTMAQSLQAGAWGGIGLLAAGIAYVPVLVMWGTAYVVGAGVAIGPGVAISPFIPATAPTDLPPFPLLAALPSSATPLAWGLPVAGIVAGIVAGTVIARRARAEARLFRLTLALGAAALAAVVLLVLSHLATGSLGNGRLADLGPSPATVAVLAFVLMILGAVPSAVVTGPPPRPVLRVTGPAPDEEGTDDA